MAALPAGVQYGLSAESSYKENKDLVFVKLTDSALKAIEDFIRSNKGKRASPTIQFLPGNEGKILIPGENGQHGAATFHFSLSSNSDMGGQQGSFECVRAGAPRRLEACGAMPCKMRVHANDDVYETTRTRMEADVQHLKSKGTRVIKPNLTDIGRKVRASSGGVATGRPTAHNLTPPAACAPAACPPAAPAPARAHPPAAQQRPVAGNPDLMRRPIKERLIQLLALRPFKRLDLYGRLYSEGVRDKEKNVINNIVQQISSLKDNCYILHRHLWNDVNEDWPFYTEEEKQLLKRRKPQNLTPPLSSDSGHSSPARASSSKRTPPADAAAPHIKKQRISHYKKPDTPTQLGASDASQRTPSAGGSPTTSCGYHTSGASSGERREYSDEDLPPAALQPSLPDTQYNEMSTIDARNSVINDIQSMAEVPDEIDSANLRRDFPPITCSRQRRTYKSLFASEYEEYSALFRRLHDITQLFARLEHRLNNCRSQREEKEIQGKIIEEYHRWKNDLLYQRDRSRLQHMHRKLAHLKRMVSDYDRLITEQIVPAAVASPQTEAY